MCLNPQVILNPYNHSFYEVPCRHCLDCLLDKSALYARMLLGYKHFNSKQMLFVSLSYDNSHVPYLRFSDIKNFFDFGTVPTVHRDHDEYVFKSHGKWKVKNKFNTETYFRFPSKLKESDCSSLPPLVKTHRGNNITYFPDRIGVLDNYDVQKLFKCLRHHIKFTYYVVGEYGENTFRPHWHILFYISKDDSLFKLKSLIRRYWRKCSPANIKLLSYSHVEKYLTMYVTKVANLPSSLFHLQKSFAFYSREVGRSLPYRWYILDSTLHFVSRNKEGQVQTLLPSSRDANILFPVAKQSGKPLMWYNIFSSFFVEPKKQRSLRGFTRYTSYEPFYKFFKSPVYRPQIRYLQVKRFKFSYLTLSNLIDYSIAAQEFHTKLASQRLRDYLMESPTVYSDHKLDSLVQLTFQRDYGFKPSHEVRYFLRNYKINHQRKYDDLKKFHIQQHLNKISYGY